MKRVLFIMLGALLVLVTGCAGSDVNVPGAASDADPDSFNEPATENDEQEAETETPVPDVITGSIEMEDGGVIRFELYPDIAPQSVRNFVYLVREGFYDGLRFHRIMSGFMIQGGCPYTLELGSGDPGTGNPGYSILGEFDSNGVPNSLSHTRGVMSMARGGHNYNSAGSQFFICHGDPQFLDGDYAAFGMVTDGMDVVDKIARIPAINNNGGVRAENMPVIASITIDGDFSMPEPDKISR